MRRTNRCQEYRPSYVEHKFNNRHTSGRRSSNRTRLRRNSNGQVGALNVSTRANRIRKRGGHHNSNGPITKARKRQTSQLRQRRAGTNRTSRTNSRVSNSQLNFKSGPYNRQNGSTVNDHRGDTTAQFCNLRSGNLHSRHTPVNRPSRRHQRSSL